MSDVIRQETIVFLSAVCHGILLTFFYDILRALRRSFAHSLSAVSAEDFLFWLAAGFATFCLLFGQTDGTLRSYVVLGIGLGAFFYHCSVSSLLVRRMTAILIYMRKGGAFLFRSLYFPVQKAVALDRKVIEFAARKAYNRAVKRKEYHKNIRHKKKMLHRKTKGVDKMAENKIRSSKRRRPSKSNRLGMYVIAVIVVVLLVGLLMQSQDLAQSNAKKEAQKEELQQQIKDEEIRAEEIARLEENIHSPDSVEKIARDKLGLVYEDDIIFQPEEK